MVESSHENDTYCSGHLNVNVLKKQQQKIIDKLFYTATPCSPLKLWFRKF